MVVYSCKKSGFLYFIDAFYFWMGDGIRVGFGVGADMLGFCETWSVDALAWEVVCRIAASNAKALSLYISRNIFHRHDHRCGALFVQE